jgi:transposase InsO family protein
VTVIDYYSRNLLACHLTHSYGAAEVSHTLGLAREAAVSGDRQWAIVSGAAVRDFVREQYSHVRIQYRTPQQLGLLERFHQTLKTKEVYWRLYENPEHAWKCLAEFHARYNTLRPHWALVPQEGGDPWVPAEVYAGGRMVQIPRWREWARAARARLEELKAVT